MIYKLAPHITKEMLVEMGFETNEVGNFYKEVIFSNCGAEVMILDYDNIKRVVSYYEHQSLGVISCNPSHVRFVKDLIDKGMVIVE